jgi:hypothetical protein
MASPLAWCAATASAICLGWTELAPSVIKSKQRLLPLRAVGPLGDAGWKLRSISLRCVNYELCHLVMTNIANWKIPYKYGGF